MKKRIAQGWIVILCTGCLLAGIVVGQATAPTLTLEQHDQLATLLNSDKDFFIKEEAIQKRFNDQCTAAMNSDPDYHSLTLQKELVDRLFQKAYAEITKDVDPKKWVLNPTTLKYEPPEAPPQPEKK